MPLKRKYSSLALQRLVRVGIFLGCALSPLACGVPQSEECAQYIECRRWYEAVFNRPQKQVNVYEADGVCWENEELASDCSKTCLDETRNLYDKLIEAEEAGGACTDSNV